MWRWFFLLLLIIQWSAAAACPMPDSSMCGNILHTFGAKPTHKSIGWILLSIKTDSLLRGSLDPNISFPSQTPLGDDPIYHATPFLPHVLDGTKWNVRSNSRRFHLENVWQLWSLFNLIILERPINVVQSLIRIMKPQYFPEFFQTFNWIEIKFYFHIKKKRFRVQTLVKRAS